MGTYVGIRFKGIVKEGFRDEFVGIALSGLWKESCDTIFKYFAELNFCPDRIPCGILNYAPACWEHEDGTATDGFEKTYDKTTGRWTFQCSVNIRDVYEDIFLTILPYFIETVEHAEVLHEAWDYSEKYELVDNEMIMTNDKFIKYW